MRNTLTVPIKKTELEDVVNALELDRAGIVRICGGIKEGAVNWWRHREKIPANHLSRLGSELAKKVFEKTQRKEALTPVEARAEKLVREKLGLKSVFEILYDLVPFTKAQLADFCEAMNWDQKQIAKHCEVDLSAVNSWQQQDAIPYMQWKKLLSAFLDRIEIEEVRPIFSQVDNHFETAMKLYEASGSAVHPDLKWMDSTPVNPQTSSTKESQHNVNSGAMAAFSDKELINELVRRGWRLSLSPPGGST